MQTNTILKSTLMTLLAAGALGTVATASAANGKMGHKDMVKCYGVNAAYKNDCKSPGHSCAGTDSKARDPNAYVAMPKGLCEKIAGGSLKPADAGAMMKHGDMKKS